MSLRLKTLLPTLVLFFLLAGVLYIVSDAILLQSFSELEEDLAQDNLTRATNALDQELLDMATNLGDWAYWDSTYQYMQGDYPDYFGVEVNPNTYESLEVDFMAFVDLDGQLVEALEYIDGEERPLNDALREYILNHPSLYYGRPNSPEADYVAGYVQTPSAPVLIASRAILRSDRSGDPVGTIIWGRYMTPETIASLGEQTRLNLTLYPLNQPSPAAVEGIINDLTLETPRTIQALNQDTVAGYALYTDLEGSPAFALSMSQPRDIYAQGQLTVSAFAGLLAVVATVGAAGLGLLLQVTVLSRLEKLNLQVKEVAARGAAGGEVSIESRDEIGQLARALNQAFGAVRATQAQLQLVVTQAPVVLFALDADTRFTLIQGQALRAFGLTPEMLLGKTIGEGFERYQDWATAAFARARKGETFKDIYTFRDVYFEFWIAPQYDEDGAFQGVFGIATDITPLKRAEVELIKAKEEAEEANQVKSRFLASMSHELRTPLNAILNFTEFIVDGVMGPVNAKQVDTLKKVITAGDHLLSLINDVLDISKIEVGMTELLIEDVNMNGVLEAAVATGRGLVKEKPVEVVTHIEADLPLVAGDKRRISQIFLNLLSNAVKFTKQGQVTVSARPEGDNLHITVTDTGVGIAPEEQQLVFEAFRQARHGLREVSGTGLGLPITKHFVEAHGGQIWLESEPGKGTTFHVTLPIKQEVVVTE